MNWRKPIIYGLLYLSESKIPKYLKEIKKISKYSKENQKEYQDAKLKKLLLHSWKYVPYYTKVLEESGVVKNGKIFLENFSKIPFLTKDIIRKNFKDLQSTDPKRERRKPYKNTSGGSTGEPVEFIQDSEYSDWNIANKIFYKTFAGQEIGDKELRLWGSERDLLEEKEDWKIRIKNWIYNRREINTFTISENDMHQFFAEWNSFKPLWIESYVQSIDFFSDFLQKNKKQIYVPKNGILTSAGVLHSHLKTRLKDVFQTPIFNRYGSREVGDMACGNNGLYISFWNNFIEISSEKNEEESKEGEVIVTNLNNYSMPLLRYSIGDIAKFQSNNILEYVKGRTVEFFKTSNGGVIDGEFFTHEFYHRDWVKKFQVIQHDYEKIEIKIEGIKTDSRKNQMKKIEQEIQQVMGKNCKIEWNFVEKINPTKSGKYIYTLSEIK